MTPEERMRQAAAWGLIAAVWIILSMFKAWTGGGTLLEMIFEFGVAAGCTVLSVLHFRARKRKA
jgi:hypothetical protein